jgi:hypothetical protein
MLTAYTIQANIVEAASLKRRPASTRLNVAVSQKAVIFI